MHGAPQSPYGGYVSSPSAVGSPSPFSSPSIRRRHVVEGLPAAPNLAQQSPMKPSKAVVRKLDFMFPKVDSEFTVRTEGGGMSSLAAYCVIAVLVMAEILGWFQQNAGTLEHISVDTSLGKKMRVNMNITFPGLACEDLHVDVMDVAGDSQLDILDTLVKKRLNLDGRPIGKDVEKAETNAHQQREAEKARILKEQLPENYCGPCFGAGETEHSCCNTCDELLEAYKQKKWRSEIVQITSEQCIREGRDKMEAKKLKKGEGCNLSGYLRVNRVAGNFHIAMGEGFEKDGRHIHSFNIEDSPDFNSSHIIHDLSFGPSGSRAGFGDESQLSLNGVSKIVTHEHGTTGLFQYFIKVVPTTFHPVRGGRPIESNAYFFTERFRPLMKEYIADAQVNHDQEEEDSRVAVQAGHAAKSKHEQHSVRNSVLPGVFFIYEIYPFAVEIRKQTVPLTHLLIRLMASVGGVFTVFKMADHVLSRRDLSR